MATSETQKKDLKDVAPHEAFRIRMVDVAMRRIARHPNWCRGFGFAVGADWWPEFLESFGAVRDEIEERIEREAEALERQGRPLARVPEVVEVLAMAVFLLLAGRKAGWPLPVGVPGTFEAMGRFVVAEKLGKDATASAESRRESVSLPSNEWTGDSVTSRRTVH